MHRSPRAPRDSRAPRSALAAALALALGVALVSPEVSAQPAGSPSKAALEEASSRFRRGVELYKEGDYRAALIEFRRAYELAPNFNVLYNMGQVHFQLQDYVGALNALERYLSEGGSQIAAARRAEVGKDIEKLKARVAKVEITANVEGAEITIDDVPSGKTPIGKPLLVSAGRRRITATKSGWLPATKLVDVAGADALRVSLELTETQPATPAVTPVPAPPASPDPGASQPGASQPNEPAPAPAPSTEAPSLAPVVIGWSVTAGLTAGAVVCGVLALDASSDLATTRDAPGASRSTLDDAKNKTTGLALATDLLAAGAIVAGGVSVYLTASRPSSAERAAAAPVVRLGFGGTAVRLDGTF